MMGLPPVINLASGLGLVEDFVYVKPQRQVGPFSGYVALEEVHVDELQITQHPVEQGAAITDHAFKKPSELRMHIGYSNSPGSSTILGSLASAISGTIAGVQSLLDGNAQSQATEIYKNFLAVQISRIPIDVYTGKRIYSNMLVKSIRESTSKETENALLLTIHLQEILIVSTATTVSVPADASNQAAPEDTNPTANLGAKQLQSAPLFNALP